MGSLNGTIFAELIQQLEPHEDFEDKGDIYKVLDVHGRPDIRGRVITTNDTITEQDVSLLQGSGVEVSFKGGVVGG